MNQRYYSLSEYFKEKYGFKIYKLGIDGGFSCPNRQEGKRGCLFCSEKGAGEFTPDRRKTIPEQIKEQKLNLQHKDAVKFLAYFQNFTNTYADPRHLKKLYDEALVQKDIIGLSIATRPDCLGEDVLDLIEQYNKKECFVELGLQTTNERTASLIRRGYDNCFFYCSIENLNQRKIKSVVHVIAGLPGEQKEDFLKTIEDIKDLGIWGIKFHSLYIQKDSDLYLHYKKASFPLLEKEEYIDWVCDALERIPASMVVHRLTGDADKSLLYKPTWSADKLSVIGGIQKELKLRKSFQGKYYAQEGERSKE